MPAVCIDIYGPAAISVSPGGAEVCLPGLKNAMDGTWSLIQRKLPMRY